MEVRNELAAKVLSSAEFLDYIEKKKAVEANESLYAVIEEYERTTAALVALMQQTDYDAAEAIRLTNDAEFLSSQIEKHPDYVSLVAANDLLQAYLASHMPTCGGSCEGCSQGCHKER